MERFIVVLYALADRVFSFLNIEKCAVSKILSKIARKLLIKIDIISIYYIDKIESLNFLINVCRNGKSEHYMSYTTRFSVSRRRFTNQPNTDIVISVLILNTMLF